MPKPSGRLTARRPGRTLSATTTARAPTACRRRTQPASRGRGSAAREAWPAIPGESGQFRSSARPRPVRRQVLGQNACTFSRASASTVHGAHRRRLSPGRAGADGGHSRSGSWRSAVRIRAARDQLRRPSAGAWDGGGRVSPASKVSTHFCGPTPRAHRHEIGVPDVTMNVVVTRTHPCDAGVLGIRAPRARPRRR
jgi:hypothetical protein